MRIDLTTVIEEVMSFVATHAHQYHPLLFSNLHFPTPS